MTIDESRLDAVVAKRLGITTRSRVRDRRPTKDELDKLMTRVLDSGAGFGAAA